MALLLWLRRLLRRRQPTLPAVAPAPAREAADEEDPDSERSSDPVWCVAANVVMERDYGPGGVEKRRGTKHFAPGAKVYVYDFFWGTGGDNVTVIGRHRKSRRFIRLSMQARHLANWRAELVYSPYIAKVIREQGESGRMGDAGSDTARRRAEEVAAMYVARGARSQPFVTRPPKVE